MGGVCVMEHRKKNIEDENLDPTWRVRYDNMEGGLVIGWFAPQKIEEGSATSTSHLTFQSSEVAQRAIMEFVIIDSEYYFPISAILAHNDTLGIDFFLVEWKGTHKPTWELLEDLIDHGSSALTEYLLSECASIAASIGLSRIANGISESTSCQGQRLGRSKTLERNLRLFLRSGRSGTRSSTASLEASRSETIPAKTTSKGSTSTSPSSCIPQTPVELWSTASDSPERWLGPGLANLEVTTAPRETLLPLSPDGGTITPRRRRRLAKTISPVNLGKLLENTAIN